MSAAKQLKSMAFELYKEENWPAGVDQEVCDNYHKGDDICSHQGTALCESCATYTRLVEEFQAVPVG